MVSDIETLQPGDHMALIYRTRAEQFAAICPFVKSGLARRERCLYIANDTSIALVLDKLSKARVDTVAALKNGSLLVGTKKDTFQESGHFEPEKMVARLRQELEEALSLGFSGLRATGEMTWTLEEPAALKRLIEYEGVLHQRFPSQLTGLCQYDETRFSPTILSDVIRIHPKIIVRGRIHQNPFLTDPDRVVSTSMPHLRSANSTSGKRNSQGGSSPCGWLRNKAIRSRFATATWTLEAS